jgi:hypothetical protein
MLVASWSTGFTLGARALRSYLPLIACCALFAASAHAQGAEPAPAGANQAPPCESAPCEPAAAGEGKLETQTVVNPPQPQDDQAPVANSPAHLQLRLDKERPEPLPGGARRVWYGWQTLLVDALSIGTIAIGSSNAAPVLIGLGGLVLGSPIVHWAHENGSAGAISLGIRAGSTVLTFVGAVVTLQHAFSNGLAGDTRSGATGPVLMLVGLGGMVTAIVVDAAVLAFTTVHSSPVDVSSDANKRFVVLPWVDERARGGGLRFGLVL